MRAVACLALGALALGPSSVGWAKPRTVAQKKAPGGTGSKVYPVVQRPGLSSLAHAAKPALLVERRPVTRADLASGARLLVQRDAGLSSVAVCLVLEVGTRDEGDDDAGAASALGFALSRLAVSTPSIAARIAVEARGGEDELSLGRDRTVLCSAAAASELPLLLSVAAARLRAAAAGAWPDADLPALSFVDGVSEPSRRLDGLVLAGVPALDRSISDSDVHAVRGGALRAFGKAHVRSGGVGFVVVGPVEAGAVSTTLDRELAGLSLPAAAAPSYAAPPEQRSPRSVWAPDPLAAAPSFALAWAAPGSGRSSFAAVELAARVLADGAGSRLGMQAHRKPGIDSFGVAVELERGTAIVRISASAKKLADLSSPLEAEVRALGRTGPEPGEVARAAARAQLDWITRASGARGRAALLSDAELALRDAGLSSNDPLVWHAERLLAVSDDDVKDVAASVLDWQRRCVLEHQPPPPPPPPKPKPEKRPQPAKPLASPAAPQKAPALPKGPTRPKR